MILKRFQDQIFTPVCLALLSTFPLFLFDFFDNNLNDEKLIDS